MKLANVDGRAAIVRGGGGVDVEAASKGRFGPDVQSLYGDWAAFLEFAQGALPEIGEPLDESALGSPAPAPRQVFAIGLNYRSHAEETGMDVPSFPATFTKFPASLAGPFDDIEIAFDMVDWEVELVAVIGKRADRVAESEAWSHVAGLTIGQDISDRTLQFAAGAQFSLGKSRRGYGPMGPWLVTPDEVDDPDNLELGCSVNGETVQLDRTNGLILSVPRLVADLSSVLPLYPGDVIFTGTPAGVGMARHPQRFLNPGDTLTSWIEGIGSIRNNCIAPRGR
jgi:2-keto-4-pentenoate hydratase/2-oxohepta-3-ene-1,7-dioic acid hydratase in catechol pathway